MELRSQSLSQSPSFGLRSRISATVCVLLTFLALARVSHITVLRGDAYSERAAQNLRALQRIEAPRGNLHDRNGVPVAYNRKAYALSYSRRGRSEAEVRQTLRILGDLLDQDVLARKDEIMETRPSWTRHSLVRRLSQPEVIPVLERLHEFPGLSVDEDYSREYPEGTRLASVVGFLGKISPDETELFTRPLYLPDAWVGRSGIERVLEARLVGKRGVRHLTRDARGAQIEEPRILEEALPGDDIQLAVDVRLQSKACELLEGLDGSVVMMDVWNGDLIVLATSPSFDPSAPWKTEINGTPVSWINRAFQGAYPPGSTFKIVTASAALRHGWTPDTPVRCTGSYRWPGWERPFHCDVRSGHGILRLEEAIERSCNVYFFKAGHDVGGIALEREARAWGFGVETDLDLPGERRGSFTPDGEAPRGGELLNVAIGQGGFVATPLQVARAYAALANGGNLLQPRVANRITSPGRPPEAIPPHSTPLAMSLTSHDRQVLISGFERVVSGRGGTGRKVGFLPEWEVCGKTGTAENGRGGVDAWFVAFLPRSAPTHVIVAHVEDAEGHGGDNAGPIVRELIREWKAETPTTNLAALQP